MEFKKILRKTHDFNIINTDRFKTNLITFSFVKKFKKEDVAYLNLLSFLLTYSSKKYDKPIKLAKKLEDLYLCNIFSTVKNIGNVVVFIIEVEYLNTMYTESKMDKESVDLLLEVLFNPNVIDNAFEEKSFLYAKKNLINNIKSSLENPYLYGAVEFKKLLHKGTNLETTFGNVEDYEKITSKDLYKYYKNLFNEKLIISILGNYKNDNLIEYIDSKLNLNPKAEEIRDIYSKAKIKNNILIKEEELEFKQSHLFIGYKFTDLTDFEKHYVINLYSLIFGGDTNSLLFNIVREENGLCYSISSNAVRYNNTLNVHAGINKNDFNKCVDLIKACFNKMSDEKLIKEKLETAKNTIYTSINTLYDDMEGIEYQYFLKNFDNIDSIEEKKEKVASVKVEDILNLNKKIKLDTIYFLKGIKE